MRLGINTSTLWCSSLLSIQLTMSGSESINAVEKIEDAILVLRNNELFLSNYQECDKYEFRMVEQWLNVMSR